ncbi:MAG: protein kinase, partial [Chloroflexota bacterium]
MASRKLGKYELFERLGRGGMAEVYRAHHLSLDRFVAIKILHPFLADDPEFKDRFEKEARNIARLKHPSVVQVYDFENDAENESYYMVMELVEGPTLKELLASLEERGEMMSLEEVLRIVREAAGALAYAHSQKMIHRDVKPANLMLDKDERVVLTDFGIAKIVTGVQFTSSGGMVGTPAYMAPEQGLGDAGDERSDLYSLGVIFYQLVTGTLPYEAETPLAIILKHLNEPIPSARDRVPELPESVDTVIQRLMAKDPADRYQTANQVIADVERVERGEPVAELGRAIEARPRDITPLALRTPRTPAVGRALVIPTSAAAAPPRRRIPLWLWVVFGGILGAGIFGALQGINGNTPLLAFLASDTPTVTSTLMPIATETPTLTPSATATFTETPTDLPTATTAPSETPAPTDTALPSATSTLLPSATYTPSLTATDVPTRTQTLTPSSTLLPTITLTPSITPTATLDITLTLIQATLLSDFQTATVN